MSRSEKQIGIREMMERTGVRFGTSGARGRVADMSDEVCFAYTAAFLQAAAPEPGSAVALGMDLRPSSPRIAAACAAAIRHAGCGVDYCGPLPTPALALHAANRRMPALMVTGSHIPFDRNGIKFYGSSGEISKSDEARIAGAVVDVPVRVVPENLPEERVEARRAYVDRYLSFFPESCLAGMRLGFYEHSSVARDILRELLEALGAEVLSLGRTDEFVPIDTEAVGPEDIERARRWSAEYGLDALLSTDGDADRPLVGDENGRWLRGDITGILSARILGASAVATTVSCTTAIERCGAFPKVLRTRIGSPYVIEAIERLTADGERPVVGFEPNGGFLVGTAIERGGRTLAPLLTRDAALPILCLLSAARARGVAVSRLSADLPARFTASDRLQNFPTQASADLLRALAAEPEAIEALLGRLCGKPAKIDQTDGLRIFFDNGEIVHLRPSGNAPELRCYAESSAQERSEALVRETLRRIVSGAGSGG